MTDSKRKIDIDVNEWDTGDWPDDLKGCFTLTSEKDAHSFSLSLAFDNAKLDAAAKKIATEAVETFFEEVGFFFSNETLDIISSAGDVISIPVADISGPDGEDLDKPPRGELIDLLKEARGWLIEGSLPMGSTKTILARFDAGLEDVGVDVDSLHNSPKH